MAADNLTQALLTDIESNQDVSLDVLDPTTGLKKRERLVVQQTFEAISKKLGRAVLGRDIFYLFFQLHPAYLQLFKALRDIPPEQLKTHPRLKAHGLNAIQALAAVIENLEDTETTVLLLEKTGRDHVRRKLQSKHFEDFHSTTVALLKRELGPSFTPFVEQSWNKAFTVVNTVILGALRQEQLDQGIES
ncbi:hypothetical protein BV898_08524 [Hypsibius exemplaris]|uniref:Globin domain-containing protein n=1 Tax=Hypsibius exemplaris TaxID=2072580 RepID=A0A1W0WQD3_HYPEX|nr:hypothetical protein BV898_08524 [Hypsibius exemplaris]